MCKVHKCATDKVCVCKIHKCGADKLSTVGFHGQGECVKYTNVPLINRLW